jgi:hypothetical protein
MITVVVGSSEVEAAASEVLTTGMLGVGCSEAVAHTSEVITSGKVVTETNSPVTVVVAVVVTVTVDGPSVSGHR